MKDKLSTPPTPPPRFYFIIATLLVTILVAPADIHSQVMPQSSMNLTAGTNQYTPIAEASVSRSIRLIKLSDTPTLDELCSGSVVEADHGNPEKYFSLSQQSCVTVSTTGSACCVDPYPPVCCWFGIILGGGDPNPAEFTPCGQGSGSWTFCLQPGNYTLSVDVCKGGGFMIECKPQLSCPTCN